MDRFSAITASVFRLAEDEESKRYKKQGVMIGTFFDTIVVPGVADPHVTIGYCGSCSDFGDEGKRAYVGAVEAACKKKRKFTARDNGTGIFVNDDEIAVVVLVDSPELPGLRFQVESELNQRGLDLNRTHGFIPHLTYGYASTTAEAVALTEQRMDEPLDDIVFDHLTFAFGEEHTSFSLLDVE